MDLPLWWPIRMGIRLLTVTQVSHSVSYMYSNSFFSLRISKTRANQHLAESAIAALSSSEESDDSLVGDHSPFVKRSIHRQRHSSQPVGALQYSDDED